MTHNFHLEIIEIQQSYLAEKYASNVCQEVILATNVLYKIKDSVCLGLDTWLQILM